MTLKVIGNGAILELVYVRLSVFIPPNPGPEALPLHSTGSKAPIGLRSRARHELSVPVPFLFGLQHCRKLIYDSVKNPSITTKHLYLILTFRSHHEIFIRRSWYSVLPSLEATISCRIKKAVVGVTQLTTALISIHSSMTFLADMYSFLDPPGRTSY